MEELLERISSRELTEWQAFEQLEGPIGPVRDDLRAAIPASVIANVNRDTKKRRKPFSPMDFIPKWGEEAPEKTPEQQMGFMKMMAEAMRRGHRG